MNHYVNYIKSGLNQVDYINENKYRAKKTKYDDVVMWVPVTTDIIEKLQ